MHGNTNKSEHPDPAEITRRRGCTVETKAGVAQDVTQHSAGTVCTAIFTGDMESLLGDDHLTAAS